MNGTRAIPATVRAHAAGIPHRDEQRRDQSHHADSATPSNLPRWPEKLHFSDRPSLGTIVSNGHVPAILNDRDHPPEPKIARGSVRRGSRISSLIAETSSSPAKATRSAARNSQCPNSMRNHAAHVKFVADPCGSRAKAPHPRVSAAEGRSRLRRHSAATCRCCSPMIFSPTATISSANDPPSKNVRFCAIHAVCHCPRCTRPWPRWQAASRENKKRCKSSTSNPPRIRENLQTLSSSRCRALFRESRRKLHGDESRRNKNSSAARSK